MSECTCCRCDPGDWVALRRDRVDDARRAACASGLECRVCDGISGAAMGMCIEGRCRLEEIGLDGL